MNRHRTTRIGLAAIAVAGALAATTMVSGASAAEETLGNNLSVPAVMLPSATADGAPVLRGGACAGAINPTGSTSPLYPGYYLQKTEAVWQASCSTAASANVTVNWGDNLISRPVISARQPVRVEVALEHVPTSAMTGFTVEKLTPELEDRYATYGTRGVPQAFTKVRVFDSGARLRIVRLDGPGGVVYDGPIKAEINSVGAIVYGFNWGTKGKGAHALPGTYSITFTSVRANVIGVDPADAAKATFTSRSSTVTLVLASSAGRRGGSGSGSFTGGRGR